MVSGSTISMRGIAAPVGTAFSAQVTSTFARGYVPSLAHCTPRKLYVNSMSRPFAMLSGVGTFIVAKRVRRPTIWRRIWPELIDTEGAPAVPTQEVRDAA